MKYFLIVLLTVLAVVACGKDSKPTHQGDAAVDSDTDTDGDSDGDSDSDTDADADAGHDADSDPDSGSDTEIDDPAPALPGAPWFKCLEDNYPPDDATVVTALDLVDQYFGGEPNKQTVEAVVDFPEDGNWERIDMLLNLDCPEDDICDHWDWFANLVLVENPGDNEEIIELERYITPYGVPMCILTDVSRFGPRLKGKKTIRSFIQTWVSPGSLDGHGWRTSVKFVFHPGKSASNQPNIFEPIWPYTNLEIGNPDKPISDQMAIKKLLIPSDAQKVELRLLVTGHGQGNYGNCAEFCQTEQVVLVDGKPFSFNPWRGDCADNPVDFQLGTWQYQRAGWCPGAHVMAHVFDITSAVQPGKESTFEYQVWGDNQTAYVNTCRPDAGDATNTCTGCVFSNDAGNCDYNDTFHTTPINTLSVQLLSYDR